MKQTKIISVFLIFLMSSLSVTAVETTTYDLSYDQNGNAVRGLGLYHEYDELNRLVRIRDGGPSGELLESYTYDDQTTRLTKTDHLLNETTYYISDEFIEVRNATGTYLTVYAYDGDTLLGRKDPSGARFYYHPDHLGSTDLITDQNGNVVEGTTYKPYGQVIDGGKTSDFLYTGKEKDGQTGLYYYGARYYDPFFRHFTQPDSNIPDVYNSQALNRYMFVYGNPYKHVDSTGESPLLVTAGIGAVGGALFGATLSAVSQYRATGSISLSAVGQAAGIGAVAGGVAGLTLGLSSLALGGTATGVGLSTGAEISAGAVAGVAGGRTAQLTSNVVSGAPITQGLFDPSSIAFEAATGGLTAGLARGIRSTQTSRHIDQSTFDSPEASLAYHYSKHGDVASSKFQYVEQSRLFFDKYSRGKIPDAKVTSTVTRTGDSATKISSKQANRFGIYNNRNRKTVTYGSRR